MFNELCWSANINLLIKCAVMEREQLITAVVIRSLMPLFSEHFVIMWELGDCRLYWMDCLPLQFSPSPWKPSLHRHPRIGLQVAFGWQSTPMQESSAGDIKTHRTKLSLATFITNFLSLRLGLWNKPMCTGYHGIFTQQNKCKTWERPMQLPWFASVESNK